LVKATAARLEGAMASDIKDAFARVQDSHADPDEEAWCIAAGRLGLDPYDPDTPDIDEMAGTLSPNLFAELSEAATMDELPAARRWIEDRRDDVAHGPTIDLCGLGVPPGADADDHPAHTGYNAAKWLQDQVGRNRSQQIVDQLVGLARPANPAGPRPVQGVVRRVNGTMRAHVRFHDEPQRRFRMCHALYVGWHAPPGEELLVGPARTRRHQAARAFAAELLVPTALLRDRTDEGRRRPSAAEVSDWALEFATTPHVVREQLWNRLRVTPRLAT
jgi:hypothetical protein